MFKPVSQEDAVKNFDEETRKLYQRRPADIREVMKNVRANRSFYSNMSLYVNADEKEVQKYNKEIKNQAMYVGLGFLLVYASLYQFSKVYYPAGFLLRRQSVPLRTYIGERLPVGIMFGTMFYLNKWVPYRNMPDLTSDQEI